MMFVLVTYDISDTKRRQKIASLLESYGFRVNYSVFELDVSNTEFRNLLSRLKELTARKDNVRIYFLDKQSKERSFVLHSDDGVFDGETLYF